MNKELEQAAERIANQLFNLTADTIDGITKYQNGNELLQSAKLLILTDPLILELVKDREKLETLYQFCLSQKMLILNACFYDETQKKFAKIMLDIERNRSAIEQGKKVGA